MNVLFIAGLVVAAVGFGAWWVFTHKAKADAAVAEANADLAKVKNAVDAATK